jgi:hypothetical protein
MLHHSAFSTGFRLFASPVQGKGERTTARVTTTVGSPPGRNARCRAGTGSDWESQGLFAASQEKLIIGSEYGEVSLCHFPVWICEPAAFLLANSVTLSGSGAFQPRKASPALQGFVQFTLNGDPAHLDVDTLNERLKSKGAVRMRHALRPDEAFGMIFNYDGVIANTRKVHRRAWELLAEEEQLAFPAAVAHRQLYDIRPERVIMEVWGAK